MHFDGVLGLRDDGGASKARRGGNFQRLLAPIQRARSSLSPKGRALFTSALLTVVALVFCVATVLPLLAGVFDGRDPSTRALATDTLSGGHSLVKGEEEEEHDLWRKHFKSNDAVTWDHFALVLSLEFGQDLKELPKAILPKFGKQFVDKDGLVSRARYSRYVTQYGLHGLEAAAQGAVNKTMGEVRALKLRGGTLLNPKGCAVSLSSADNTYVKLSGSESFEFQGVKPLTLEVWIRPRAAKDFGGTILSKYNRGRMGQFFIHVEQNGAVFFHREVAPWGLRSNVRVPAGVW